MKTIKLLNMAALVVMGAIIASCNKVENDNGSHESFTYTTTLHMGAGTRTVIDASTGAHTFKAGDQIAVIYTNNNSETVKATSYELEQDDLKNGNRSAKFTITFDQVPDKTQPVTYIYPASMANIDGSINYNALDSQEGTLETLASKYDLCTSSGAWANGTDLPSLTLENQLAILAITLKDNAATPAEITSSITGMTISDGTNDYAVTREAAAGPIYVAIRPVASANIDITATDGTTNYTKSLTGKTYAQGNGYSVSWRMAEVPDGAINGKFTIDADGNQVRFSQGNLQATYNGSAWSWAFAENQWDYIGGRRSVDGSETQTGNNFIDGDGTVSANGTVDLFGWSTSATTYGIHNSTEYSTYSGDFVDWGTTIDDGNTWRTLTNVEWRYLFDTRTTGGTVGTTAQARYTHATIRTDVSGGVNGMILFPDGVDIANTTDYFTTLGSVNINSDIEWDTQCTADQWTALAAKGCVFLPAAGSRGGAWVAQGGSCGYYWSSSLYDADAAYRVTFSRKSLSFTGSSYRKDGFSVRLVRTAE